MDKLVVCEGCRRHVKEHDAACPFCKRGLPRAGLAIAAAVAVSVSMAAACGTAAYGPPPGYDGGDNTPDAAKDAGGDAPDGGMMMGAYGPPPPDGGSG